MSRSIGSTMRLPSALLLVLTTVLLFTSLASSACFAPDGSIEGNLEYVPCANDTADPLHKICCATNRTPDRGPDVCEPNGLCRVGLKKGETPPPQPAYTKPQCVNSNYDEPGCLHVCGKNNLGYVTACDAAAGTGGKRWCCGYKDTDCCNRQDAEIILPDFADTFALQLNSSSSSSSAPTPTRAPSTPQSSSAAPTASSSTGSTGASGTTSAQTAAAQASSGLSTGAKAGFGVGITLGALLLIAGGFFLGRYLLARKKDNTPYSNGTYDAGGYQHGAVTYANKADAVHDQWLSGRMTPTCELADEKKPVEMGVHTDPKEKF